MRYINQSILFWLWAYWAGRWEARLQTFKQILNVFVGHVISIRRGIANYTGQFQEKKCGKTIVIINHPTSPLGRVRIWTFHVTAAGYCRAMMGNLCTSPSSPIFQISLHVTSHYNYKIYFSFQRVCDFIQLHGWESRDGGGSEWIQRIYIGLNFLSTQLLKAYYISPFTWDLCLGLMAGTLFFYSIFSLHSSNLPPK